MSTEKSHEFVLVYLPTPQDLTPEQENYWWEQLEIAERKVEYAKRMLGQIAIERGLEG